MSKLSEIQANLKAPKNQFNGFGKYKYRNCEDILEGLKPLLGDSTLIITDEIVLIGDRYYVKATATFNDGENAVSVCGYARESLNKKGMDDSQVTGSTSSYARKYALNGLFLIDDTKDADSDDSTASVAPIASKEQTIVPDQAKYLGELIEAAEGVDLASFLKQANIQSLNQLAASRYQKACEHLRAKSAA